MRMRRGVGYCQDPSCEEYGRGVFLLNHQGEYRCPACREAGWLERERGAAQSQGELFKEVRVEYNFDPLSRTYRDVAIIQDVSIWGRSNVYTLQSPLIRTEKRALKVAEAVLANLNRCPKEANGDGLPNTSEVVLSLDEPSEEFRRKLRALARELEQSGLRLVD